MTKAEEKAVITPAYGSYKTFKAFVGTLNDTTIPDRIDRSMMSKMSGVTQAEVLTAMRFLGLTDVTDRPKESLLELVNAYNSGQKWEKELAAVLKAGYEAIVGNLSIETGTAKQLHECFRTKCNLDGFMLIRAVRFYLAALKDAGVQYSPHFKPPPEPKGNGKRPGKTPPSTANSGSGTGSGTPSKKENEQHTNGNTLRIPIPSPNDLCRVAIVPADLTESDCDMIDAMLRAVATRLKSVKQKTTAGNGA
jgi:hypothetical protein